MKWWLIALLLFPGLCAAQSVAGCQFSAPAQMIIPQPDFSSLESTVYAHLDVECEQGIDYQIEVQDAAPGGLISLTAPGVADAIPVMLINSDNGRALGQLNQGEAITGTGTGSPVSHPIEATVRMERMPAAGNYSTTLQITFVF